VRKIFLLSVLLVVVAGCASNVTLRRIVHYPAVGMARYGLEGLSTELRAGWTTQGLAHARSEALAKSRPLLVYLYTSWCGPCKRLSQDTFPDASIVRLLSERLVAVKLDGESPEGRELVRQYRINSYPTFLFFRADGAEIDRAFGYQTVPQLVRTIHNMLSDRNTVAHLRRQLRVNPDSVVLNHRLGFQLALRGESEEATVFLRRAVELDPDNANPGQLGSQSLYVLGRYVFNLRQRDYAGSISVYEELLQRFPRSVAARNGGLDLARLHVQNRKPEQALVTLERLVGGDRSDAIRHVEAARLVLQNRLSLQKGLRWARRGTQLRQDGYPWIVVAAIYSRLGQADRELAALEEAVRRSPQNAAYQRQLARARRQSHSD
jgi:tetratricopeptide (TPR) repeat protein